MKEVNAYVKTEYEKMDTFQDEDVYRSLLKIPIMTNLDGLRADPERWSCVRLFFHRRWFSRCWVLGEVGVSKEATVFSGRWSMAWSEFALFIEIASRTTISNFSGVPSGRLTDVFATMWSVMTTESSWKVEIEIVAKAANWMKRRTLSDSMALLRILDIGTQFDASDDRDHIFAFLGHPLFIGFIEPNYSWTIEETHRRVAERILHSTKSLDMLCYVENRFDDLKGTSWIPQWNRPRKYWGDVHSNLITLTPKADEVLFEITGSRLRTTAIIVDIVVTHSLPLTTEIFKSVTHKYGIIKEMWSMIRGSPWMSFVCTLVYGKYDTKEWLINDFLDYCKKYCRSNFFTNALLITSKLRLHQRDPQVRSAFQRSLERHVTIENSFPCEVGILGWAPIFFAATMWWQSLLVVECP
jgi:hypothetical protein